jgi:hypothetical protein
MLSRQTKQGTGAYPIKPMRELDNEPPINWLVKDWIADREFSVFWGDAGAGKSFVAQGLSLQLSWSGRRVVYAAAEGSSGLAARVHAWNALNIGNPYKHSHHWWYMPTNVNMDVEEDWKTFSNSVNDALDERPDLVVLDTLARNFSGDENSARDMGQFIEGVETFRRDNECAVWVIHHANMSQENKRERGSTSLRAATFGMYKCSDARRTNEGASLRFECDRLKDGNPPDPVRVDLKAVELDADMDGIIHRRSLAMKAFPQHARPAGDSDEPDSELPHPTAKQTNDDDTIDLIRDRDGGMTGIELAEATGWTVKAANRHLYRLQREGRLKKREDGVYVVA